MVSHIPDMIASGVSALKIEGRMKGIHYVASAVKVYREAIDAWYHDPNAYEVKGHWRAELTAISHRGYGTGFYFEDPHQTASNLDNLVHPGRRFVAQVEGPGAGGGAKVLVKNKIIAGDRVEVLSPGVPAWEEVIRKITDHYGTPQRLAQPGSNVTVYTDTPLKRMDLIRSSMEAVAKDPT